MDMDLSDEPEDMSMEEDESSESYRNAKHKSSKKNKHKKRRVHISDESDDSDGGAKELYCICRSSKSDQFMICCDKCEEWFHGPCVNITQAYSRRIANYYCPLCISKDSTLEIKLKETKVKKEKPKNEFADFFSKENAPIKSRVDRDEDYERNLSSSDEDDDDEFRVSVSRKKTSSKPKTQRKDSNKKKKERKNKNKQKTKTATSKSKGKKRSVTKKSHGRGRHKMEKSDEEEEDMARQCLGVGCILAARKQSKYCSDECGITLNIKRMMEILPKRIEEWQRTPSAGDEFEKKELERIRAEQSLASKTLEGLNSEQAELDRLIAMGKSCLAYTEEEYEDIVDNDPENDFTFHCCICSHEISTKLALKHMEKCSNKIEAQSSYCSSVKANFEGVFCDTYNPHQRTYCKRLRVLCPEHSRDQKISETEVCGCPIPSNEDPFADSKTRFCRILRKKCHLHYGWEKFRQAAIDSKRIQQMLKWEELMEKEQKLIQTSSNRHGVVSLLLHQTINHW